MPDVTPARLSLVGGSIRTGRFAPARLSVRSGVIITSRETAATAAAAVPKLDRLTFADRIPGESEQSFMRRVAIWQSTMEAIEAAFAAVNARVDELAILARLSAVEQLAEVANDTATSAQAQVETSAAASEQTFEQIDPIYREAYRDYLRSTL